MKKNHLQQKLVNIYYVVIHHLLIFRLISQKLNMIILELKIA